MFHLQLSTEYYIFWLIGVKFIRSMVICPTFVLYCQGIVQGSWDWAAVYIIVKSDQKLLSLIHRQILQAKITQQQLSWCPYLVGFDEKTPWLKTRSTGAKVRGVQRKIYN